MHCPPGHSRNIIGVQGAFKLIGINPFLSKDSKRKGISYADIKIVVQLSCHPGRRVADCALRIRDIGRRGHPGKACVDVEHISFPTLHRHHQQLAFKARLLSVLRAVQPLFVYQHSQLTHRKAVDIRDFVLTYKRMETIAHQGALHFSAAQGIGPVKHHYRDFETGAGAHHEPEGGDEGIGAAAHILDIVQDNIHSLEHLRRRLTGSSVKGMHRKTGSAVYAGLDFSAGIDVTSDAVLRREKGHQVHPGGFEEDVNC